MTVPPPPRVRELRPTDHAAVGRLLLAAYDAVGPFDQGYRDFLADPSQWVPGATAALVAVDDHDVPIGCVALVLPGDAEFEGVEPPAGDAGFRFLAVAPEAQGSGAGAALVDAVIDHARSRGCRRMAIHTMEFMRAAQAMYVRRGFVRRPDLDVQFPSGIGVALTYDLVPDAAEHFPAPGPVPDTPPWYADAWAPDQPLEHPIC